MEHETLDFPLPRVSFPNAQANADAKAGSGMDTEATTDSNEVEGGGLTSQPVPSAARAGTGKRGGVSTLMADYFAYRAKRGLNSKRLTMLSPEEERVKEREGFRGPETSDDGVVVDIPTGLLIPPSVKACGKVGGALGQGAPAGRGLGLRGGGGGGGDPAKEFGLGLPSFGNLARADGDKTPATMAASVTWAAVRDAVLSYAASDPAELTAPEAIKASVTRKTSAVRGRHRMGKIEDAGSDFGEHHPYDLLLPPDLWRAAFEPLPQAQPAAAGGGVVASLPFIHTVGGDMTASGMRGTGQQREFPRAAVNVLHGGAVPAPVAGAGSEEDMRLHGVVLSALRCSVDTTAAFAMDVYEAGEWGEEVRGHSLQVSASLLVTVVGEVFARGLGLGDEAKRCVV